MCPQMRSAGARRARRHASTTRLDGSRSEWSGLWGTQCGLGSRRVPGRGPLSLAPALPTGPGGRWRVAFRSTVSVGVSSMAMFAGIANAANLQHHTTTVVLITGRTGRVPTISFSAPSLRSKRQTAPGAGDLTTPALARILTGIHAIDLARLGADTTTAFGVVVPGTTTGTPCRI